MRAGSLSSPEAADLLKNFIVASWHGRGEAEMPADVKELWSKAEVEKDTNVFMLVLDADGRLLHAFQALPKKRDRDHLKNEIAKVKVPERKDAPRLALPDGKGVRLFLRSEGAAPLVEIAREDWKALARPDAKKDVPAETFKAWLALLYPPAIRTADQSKPFTKFGGTLTLAPAGKDTVILRGEIKLEKGEGESSFEGTIEAIVTYAGDAVTVRGVVEGAYVYRQRGEQKIKMTIAFESRP